MVRSAAAATAFAMVMAFQAQAADKPPEWLKRPTDQDLLSVWPPDALRTGKGGTAMIDCLVALEGTLYGCRIASEKPAGAGFGPAALALTPQLLMKPAIKDGKPVRGAPVRIPIEFMTPEAPIGSHLGGIGRNTVVQEVLSNIPWREAPNVAQVAAAYPAKARERGVGGTATFSCRLTAEGHLASCRSIREEPRGFGVAAAARELTDKFRAPETLADGRSIGGYYTQVAISFSPRALTDPAAIGKPEWASLPAQVDVARLYPPAARKARVGGRASMNCLVGAGGRLEQCTLVSETPAGQGFGEAALALAPRFALKSWTSEGLPSQGGRVTVPIRFEPPSAEELAAEKAN